MRTLTCAALALLVGLVGCNGTAEPDSDIDGDSPEALHTANELDLSYISDEFCAAAVINLEKLFKSPILANKDLENLLVETKEGTGVDPRELKQVIALFEDPAAGGNSDPALILRFIEPIDEEFFISNKGFVKRKTPQGETYYVKEPVMIAVKSDDGQVRRELRFKRPLQAAYFPDKTTVLIAFEPILLKMISARDAKNALKEELRHADDSHDFVGAFVLTDGMRAFIKKNIVEVRGEIPLEMKALRPAVNLADNFKSATLTGSLSAGSPVTLTISMDDEKSTTELEAIANEGITAGEQLIDGLGGEAPYYVSLAQDAMTSLAVEKNGMRVSVGFVVPDGIDAAVTRAIREAGEAAEKSALSNDMKNILLGMQNHRDHRRIWPPAKADETHFDQDGRPHLSWRVHILPYLEDWDFDSPAPEYDWRDLYEQFHLDEPWDSEHNIKLLDKMPDVFVGNATKPGETTMLTIVGPGSFYEGKAGSLLVKDGESRTVAIVCAAADKAVPWTKPVDLPLEADDPVSALGDVGDEFPAAFVDGSVVWFPKSISAENFRAIITRSGGEPVDPYLIGEEQ